MTDGHNDIREKLLDAALQHVPFDGWNDTAFRGAVSDTGTDPVLARAVCPRGAVDLALAFHARGDAEMVRRLNEADLDTMRFRDRIATAVRSAWRRWRIVNWCAVARRYFRCRNTLRMARARSGIPAT